jgi:hypothetical protein
MGMSELVSRIDYGKFFEEIMGLDPNIMQNIEMGFKATLMMKKLDPFCPKPRNDGILVNK